MSRFIILGPTFNSKDPFLSNYRGIDRLDTPLLIINESEDISDDFNEVFSKYIDLMNFDKEDGSYISELEEAQKIIKVFNKYNSSDTKFKVVELVRENEKKPSNGVFLGIDIMKSGHSGAFVYSLLIEERFKDHFYNKYRELLNSNLLFNSFDSAKLFIQHLENYFNQYGVFTAIALYEINESDSLH